MKGELKLLHLLAEAENPAHGHIALVEEIFSSIRERLFAKIDE